MKPIAEYLEMAKTIKANYDKTVAEANNKSEQLAEGLKKAKNAASQALAAGDKETYTTEMQEAEFLEKRLAIEEKTVASPYKTAAEHNAFMNECKKAVRCECAPHYQKMVELIQQLTAEHESIKSINAKAEKISYLLGGCGIPTGIPGAQYSRAVPYGDSIIGDFLHNRKITGVINHIKSCYIPKQPTPQD